MLILKKGDSAKEVAALEKKLFQLKAVTGFDAKKFNGTLSLANDPLEIQKKLRDEWERDFS